MEKPSRPALPARFGARLRRGTLRQPGPDLRKMPVGLDLGGISVAEGLRAAVASAAILLANGWIGSEGLTLAAFAANFTCFCDTGGPVRSRVPALVAFTVFGAVTWCALGLIHSAGALVLAPLSAALVFCNSMARVWGVRAQAVGNVLTVVLALAVDRPLTPPQALELFVAFLGGGAWAILLTIFIWRINPNRPALRLLAANWRLMAAFSRDLQALLAKSTAHSSEWEAHARGHRRAVRDALEEARATLVESVRPPGPATEETSRNFLVLETQEGVFGALIALSDTVEAASDASSRAAARRLLRRLRPLLTRLGRKHTVRPDRLASSLDRMAADGSSDPRLANIAGTLLQRLRVVARLSTEERRPEMPPFPAARGLTVAGLLGPLRANLTWTSAVLRHATRAAVLVLVAVAVALLWPSPYAHWLTITVALTMQPYFAATWQRALERVAGTVLGAIIGGALSFLPHTPLATSILLVPLSIVGFSVRQVSYGAYIACLTPLTVLLFDVAEPGHADWVIAGIRTLYTVGGGVMVVLACMVLWPTWEPDRTEGELRTALDAHARYAEALFAALAGETSWTPVQDLRRKAGVASNNLEASLSRALQEPRHGDAARIEALLAADAALRRLAGALLTLQVDGLDRDAAALRTVWRVWLPAALLSLAARRPLAAPAPGAPPESTFARVGRMVAMLDEILSAPGTSSGQRPADRG